MTAMRRNPELRYPNVAALLGDLERLDALNPDHYDLSAEPPVTGGPGSGEVAVLLRFAGAVAVGFVSIVAVVIALTIALR